MPKFPIPVAAVAFDLDGTLVDTLPDLHEAANRMLGDLGRPVVAESAVRSYVGDGVDRLVKRLLTGDPDGEPDAALFGRAGSAFCRHYASVLSRASRPFPGVVEGLQEMRRHGLKLACITNKPAGFTEPLLRDIGLAPYLDLVLIMSVNPGFSGQKFIPAALAKLRAVRERIEKAGRDVWLEVDGGVKVDNIAEIARAGADTFVAGSAIFGTRDYKATIAAMRFELSKA